MDMACTFSEKQLPEWDGIFFLSDGAKDRMSSDMAKAFWAVASRWASVKVRFAEDSTNPTSGSSSSLISSSSGSSSSASGASSTKEEQDQRG
jgi:hypothetical protein